MNLGDLFDEETANQTKSASKGGFEAYIAPGNYTVSIFDLKMAEKDGRPYAVIEFKVQGGDYDGLKASKFYWMDEAKKRSFFYADIMRISDWDGTKANMPDASALLGNKVDATMKINKYQGNEYSNWYFNGLKNQDPNFDPNDEVPF